VNPVKKNLMMKKLQSNSKDLEKEINFIKEEIQQFKNRNLEKDSNKAWETSLVRKFAIALFTYFIMVIMMNVIGVTDPFENALIPTIGFFLSTLSLSIIRSIWVGRFKVKL